MSYELIEDKDNSFYSVKITDGPYSGVVYEYGRVSLKHIEETDEAQLSYSYEVIEGDNTLEGDVDFENYIGDILSEILVEAFDTGNYKIGGNDGKSGNNNSKESD